MCRFVTFVALFICCFGWQVQADREENAKQQRGTRSQWTDTEVCLLFVYVRENRKLEGGARGRDEAVGAGHATETDKHRCIFCIIGPS